MDEIKRPFQVKIIELSEVRMGSPYNYCKIELIGFDKIKLKEEMWQDRYAWSDDSKRLVLISWDFENNIPGFHFFLIDTESGKTKTSPRINGLPNSLSIENEKIKFNKFLYDKEKSEVGKLCCHIDEEFIFNY